MKCSFGNFESGPTLERGTLPFLTGQGLSGGYRSSVRAAECYAAPCGCQPGATPGQSCSASVLLIAILCSSALALYAVADLLGCGHQNLAHPHRNRSRAFPPSQVSRTSKCFCISNCSLEAQNQTVF